MIRLILLFRLLSTIKYTLKIRKIGSLTSGDIKHNCLEDISIHFELNILFFYCYFRLVLGGKAEVALPTHYAEVHLKSD